VGRSQARSGVLPARYRLRSRRIAYVGDHCDYDIAAGLQPILIRRDPWGRLWADDPIVRAKAAWVIDSLAELPDLIRLSGT
jgi:hypothetical protein